MAIAEHRFRFFRSGGFDQVLLDRGEDLLALDQLDLKLWSVLSCPVKGLELDEDTLRLIDSDGDGRLRPPEILAAAQWACKVLRDPEYLIRGGSSLPLRAIADDAPEGRRIVEASRQILRGLGKEGEEEIRLADVIETYARMRREGGGSAPPGSLVDGETARVVREIVDCLGGVEDRSGAVRISREKAERFFDEAVAFDGWWRRAESDREAVLPLGEETWHAAALLSELREKVDDWFARSRLAAFDPRALAALNRDADEYAAIADRILSPTGVEVASFPLARIVPDGALPLGAGLNPAWAERMRELRRRVVAPILGDRHELRAEEWEALLARFAPFEAWISSKEGQAVETIGIARVREILRSDLRSRIGALLDREEALQATVEGFASVERLLRYRRDLYRLLQNFVSLSDFYSSKREAIFQAGTLYIDRRSCDLCIRVSDVQAHAAVATASQTFLAYCVCTRKSDGKQMTIAAAFTAGDADNLVVGRNGLFYDRQGNDWDATIVKLIEHPISIRQAFWAPYKRLSRLVGEQIERLASDRNKKVQEGAASRLGELAENKEGAPPTAKEQAFDIARFAGIFAAIGLALGAIGTAVMAVVSSFLNLAWWQMPLALVGGTLLVSGPSMIIAWLKLRRRALGPILDGNGWAVNAHATINIPFGTSLTSVASLPPSAARALIDPYAPRRGPWPALLVVLLVVGLGLLAWYGGARWFSDHGGVVAEEPAAAEGGG